jgi:hypothetical protein
LLVPKETQQKKQEGQKIVQIEEKNQIEEIKFDGGQIE